MKKYLLLFTSAIFLIAAPLNAGASSLKITGPYASIRNNDIIVNTGIVNVKELRSSIMSGVEKEVIFTVELFRVWPFWPDEFVSSKKVRKTIKYDNLREEFRASSSDASAISGNRFRNFSQIEEWLSSAIPVSLGNVKGLDKGKYYVRVVVESKSMDYPLFIGMLMHLIPEREMSLAKESPPFIIGDGR
ncbi:MAG: DUF4390 domain-containing protein [Nitrospirae bacterium]|nr:DUF4390 domain-containing protein [Nitrospirota bacterium]